jgi:signal transduction histidine kinase
MKPLADAYARILEQVVLVTEPHTVEPYLTDAFELGRRMVERGVPPDELINIHHEAILQLARFHPSLIDRQTAQRLSGPLMEMSMSYGMVFRQQMEQRYQALVQTRLEQSQKMEAVGTLAAGIAHDFNNMLGAIVGFAELVSDELSPGSSGEHYVQQILQASYRARDMISSMLTFARQGQRTQQEPVEMVSQVRTTLQLMRSSYGPAIQLVFQPQIERAVIMSDPVQPQQIVMNLCSNAADASNNQGEIVVRMELDTLVDSRCPQGHPAICLSVSDQGHGMPPEVQQRIFDPFFTTKAPGKGSGLGLSVVHGIVMQLGGDIRVKSLVSGPERGTIFSVLLPLVEDGNISKGEK